MNLCRVCGQNEATQASWCDRCVEIELAKQQKRLRSTRQMPQVIEWQPDAD